MKRRAGPQQIRRSPLGFIFAAKRRNQGRPRRRRGRGAARRELGEHSFATQAPSQTRFGGPLDARRKRVRASMRRVIARVIGARERVRRRAVQRP